MNKLLLIGLTAVFVFAGNRADRWVIKNSYGYDSLAIFDDSVLIDTSGAGDYNKKAVADTSQWIDVQEGSKFVYMWQLNTTAADGDSITYNELVLCGDDLMGYVGSNDWYSFETITDTITIVNTVFGRGFEEIALSGCDSVAFISVAIGATDDQDTIHVTKRVLKVFP